MPKDQLPLLALADRVVFPKSQLRLNVVASSTLQLLKDLLWEIQASPNRVDPHKLCVAVFCLKPNPQRKAAAVSAVEEEEEDGEKQPQEQEQDMPTDDLHAVGTMARIVQITRSNSGLSIVLQGICRIRRLQSTSTISSHNKAYRVAHVERLIEQYDQPDMHSKAKSENPSLEQTLEKLRELAKEFLNETKSTFFSRRTNEILDAISHAPPGQLADVLANALPVGVEDKQRILEMLNVPQRCAAVAQLMEDQVTKLRLQQKIQHHVQHKIDGTRREFLLRQQLEAIKKELGESAESGSEDNDVGQLEKRLQQLQLEGKAQQVAKRELNRLKNMSPSQPEYSMVQNYLEFFADLPWNKVTQDLLDIDKVQMQLEQDHYGLDKVKKRIVEYIAVRSLKQDMKGPILCLVGPPGVGKTSLGKSIANATNRNFERIALGGVHDESEIRGHRKTYIGAMAGRILNALRHAESKNPVILLDEIDKIGKDFRGDPSSALLEVLDPHQNHTFTDHYLNTAFDLSSVMFVATANSMETIPSALLDRMEVIEVSGYSVQQKQEISKRYLIPRQIQENGLEPSSVSISEEALNLMIVGYTREAGVRELERVIASVCRHVAVLVARERTRAKSKQANSPSLKLPFEVTKERIGTILGPKLVFNEVALRAHHLGVVTGMSWSSVGGSILFVEASCARDDQLATAAKSTILSSANALPRLQLTGKLGDVMKESAQLALSWLRANGALIESKRDNSRVISLSDISDVHVHFPEGAIPKDGPSAGTAILCALISAIARVNAPIDLSMTGEITLRGVILPVGGIREKVLAAIRAGIQRVVLPEGNRVDAQELAKELNTTCPVEFIFVQTLSQLIEVVFQDLSFREETVPRSRL